MKVSVQPSGGHEAKAQGRRANHPDGPHRQGQFLKKAHLLAPRLLRAGPVHPHKGFEQFRDFAHPDGLAVQPGPLAAFGGEQPPAQGVVNHPQDGLVAPKQSQRGGEAREPVRVVGGSVQGVYDPGELGIARTERALLGADGVLREGCGDGLDDGFLGGQVCIRYYVSQPLDVDVAMGFQPAEDHLAGFLGRFYRHFQELSHLTLPPRLIFVPRGGLSPGCGSQTRSRLCRRPVASLNPERVSQKAG